MTYISLFLRPKSMSLSWIVARTIFYPTLWWNMLLGRWLKVRNWWDPVGQNVIVGAFPFARDVKKMAAAGVGAVVNTCEEYEGPVENYQAEDIRQLRIPTVDFTHPSFDDVQRAVDFMIEQIDDGRVVYVHCKAGRARSATVVLCWLIQTQGMTAMDGQQLLLKSRPHVNPRLTERPVVQQFEAKYGKKES
jgi:atypical dual specificity phosphatase